MLSIFSMAVGFLRAQRISLTSTESREAEAENLVKQPSIQDLNAIESQGCGAFLPVVRNLVRRQTRRIHSHGEQSAR